MPSPICVIDKYRKEFVQRTKECTYPSQFPVPHEGLVFTELEWKQEIDWSMNKKIVIIYSIDKIKQIMFYFGLDML